jgi:hypothetical protein
LLHPIVQWMSTTLQLPLENQMSLLQGRTQGREARHDVYMLPQLESVQDGPQMYDTPSLIMATKIARWMQHKSKSSFGLYSMGVQWRIL